MAKWRRQALIAFKKAGEVVFGLASYESISLAAFWQNESFLYT